MIRLVLLTACIALAMAMPFAEQDDYWNDGGELLPGKNI